MANSRLEMAAAFDAISRELDALEREESDQRELLIRGGTVVSLSLTAGLVTWLLRSGALAALTAGSSTLGRQLDPIPVLPGGRADHAEGNGKTPDQRAA